ADLPIPPRPPLIPYTTLFRSGARRSRTSAQGGGAAAGGASAQSGTAARGDFGKDAGARQPGDAADRRPSRNRRRPGTMGAKERRSEEHTSELQSHLTLVCRLL